MNVTADCKCISKRYLDEINDVRNEYARFRLRAENGDLTEEEADKYFAELGEAYMCAEKRESQIFEKYSSLTNETLPDCEFRNPMPYALAKRISTFREDWELTIFLDGYDIFTHKYKGHIVFEQELSDDALEIIFRYFINEPFDKQDPFRGHFVKHYISENLESELLRVAQERKLQNF